MNQNTARLPLFSVIVALLMALLGLFFAFNFFTEPARLLTDVDTGQPAIRQLAFTLGTRSLSMALALLLALALRSRPALVVVLAMRVVTEALDLVNTLSGPHPPAAPVVIGVMVLAELIAIALLLRRPAAVRGAQPLATSA